jgi:hypothetical protein
MAISTAPRSLVILNLDPSLPESDPRVAFNQFPGMIYGIFLGRWMRRYGIFWRCYTAIVIYSNLECAERAWFSLVGSGFHVHEIQIDYSRNLLDRMNVMRVVQRIINEKSNFVFHQMGNAALKHLFDHILKRHCGINCRFFARYLKQWTKGGDQKTLRSQLLFLQERLSPVVSGARCLWCSEILKRDITGLVDNLNQLLERFFSKLDPCEKSKLLQTSDSLNREIKTSFTSITATTIFIPRVYSLTA